jgi:hypothetical protein
MCTKGKTIFLKTLLPMVVWWYKTSHMPTFRTMITNLHSNNSCRLPTQHTMKFYRDNYQGWINLAIHTRKMTWHTITHMVLPCLTISTFQQQHIIQHGVIGCKYINRNNVVCNHSLCDYMWLNVAYKYKWLLMRLLFKFGWILVFQLGCDYNLFHLSNGLIFHDVFVFFYKFVYMFSCTCNQDNHIIVA